MLHRLLRNKLRKWLQSDRRGNHIKARYKWMANFLSGSNRLFERLLFLITVLINNLLTDIGHCNLLVQFLR